MTNANRRTVLAAAALALGAGMGAASAENAPGITDTEIKIGNTNPYSGPASSYGTIGKSIGACWNHVNANGGINGRKIKWISYDDGYSPPKTKEQVRKLVERDQVAFSPLRPKRLPPARGHSRRRQRGGPCSPPSRRRRGSWRALRRSNRFPPETLRLRGL